MPSSVPPMNPPLLRGASDPDAHRRRPFGKFATVIEAEDLQTLDVDPEQRAFAPHPDRSLAKHGVDVGDAFRR